MAALEILQTLSNQLADAAEAAGQAVVQVDDRTRFTASGLVWSQDGLIVATSHGVEADEDLAVIFSDGRRVEATLVGRDHGTDIAVLKVAETLSAPDRANEVRAGQMVIAAGRPGNQGLQVSMGIVSSIQPRSTGNLYYTDATIGRGFSGGALFGVDGKLVGMLNLWDRRRVGVAIGVGLVDEAVQAILGGGVVQRGYLGVRAQAVELSRAGGVGLMLSGIEADSAAERAGLLLGDVLLTVDGKALESVETLSTALRSLRAGAKVRLSVLRAGSVVDIDAELQAQP
jgi:S1-C subfamily serine protease